jgi:glucoamylase
MSNSTSFPLQDLKDWAPVSQSKAFEKAIANISPADGQPGSVLASPSTSDPNYYFHWVRDAARTMRTLVATDYLPMDMDKFDAAIKSYVEFSKINQTVPTLSNSLGEPKFYVSGSAYDLPWGRPQNDGPAERAIALTRWVNLLMKEKDSAYVVEVLYDGKEPSASVIKADLDFVGHHWQDPCFCLWEEVDGTHFYTRMQQRTALREGAALATLLNDPGAADFYNQQAQLIEADMERFWDAQNNHIKTTIDQVGGLNYKYSNLDIAIILGACYGYSKDFPFYTPHHDRVLATGYAIHQAFLPLYPINSITQTTDGDAVYPGIGRYQEDIYNPNGGKANPWFLCTLAMSSLCYQASKLFNDDQVIKVTAQNINFLSMAIDMAYKIAMPKKPLTIKEGDNITPQKDLFNTIVTGLAAMGDAYLRRVQYHGATDGSLSEQFDLNTGYMLSARDLTWSYIALIIAIDERNGTPINDN